MPIGQKIERPQLSMCLRFAAIVRPTFGGDYGNSLY